MRYQTMTLEQLKAAVLKAANTRQMSLFDSLMREYRWRLNQN